MSENVLKLERLEAERVLTGLAADPPRRDSGWLRQYLEQQARAGQEIVTVSRSDFSLLLQIPEFDAYPDRRPGWTVFGMHVVVV